MANPGPGQARRRGKKNRKHGRNKNSAAMQRYNAQDRCAKNKAKNIAKEKARQAK